MKIIGSLDIAMDVRLECRIIKGTTKRKHKKLKKRKNTGPI